MVRIRDFTQGSIVKSLLKFSIPLFIGNLLQQLYNVVDSIIVGKFISSSALASVGASFALMVLINSIIFGLCIGSSTLFSIEYGKKNLNALKNAIYISFVFILSFTILLNLLLYFNIDRLIDFMNIPKNIIFDTKSYLVIVLLGVVASFIYNFISAILRSIGNSKVPVIFILISTIINIILDLYFIVILKMGVKGAAYATVISQYVSALGIFIYYHITQKTLRLNKHDMYFKMEVFKSICNFSIITSLQLSVMNFGILIVQSIVNKFGVATIAAFTSSVKIEALAYMPAQDFSNALSTFIAQNFGAQNKERIKKAFISSIKITTIFCIFISILVFIFSKELLEIFINKENVEILNIGSSYLRVVSPFYFAIGLLFLLYAYFRAIGKTQISLYLTIVSLGTRVVLALILSKIIAFNGISYSIILGWIIADLIGFYLVKKKKISFNK